MKRMIPFFPGNHSMNQFTCREIDPLDVIRLYVLEAFLLLLAFLPSLERLYVALVVRADPVADCRKCTVLE